MSPSRQAVAISVAVILAALPGCGVQSERQVYPDASLDVPNRRDAGVDVPPYTHPSDALPMLRPLPTGLPLPKEIAPARQLLDDRAELTGGGTVSCTHQEPPSAGGDRWCVFTVPGSTTKPNSTKKNAELWVINVSMASRGHVPACDGKDPGCLLLTTNLWTEFPLGGPGHPYSQAFTGDTLIYYADANSVGDQIHDGPIYAWRPGWPRARQISSSRGLECFGHERTAVAFCMDDTKGDPEHPDSFEIRAGSIADPAGGVLPSVGRFSPFNAAGDVAWHIAFSRDGDRLAISSPDPDPKTEVLRVIATSQTATATPMVTLADLTSWTISNDDKKIYFYRAEPGFDDKSLYVANFPAGDGVTKLSSQVHDYLVIGNRDIDDGVGYLTRTPNNEPAFALLRDSGAPATAITVFTYRGQLEGVRISNDFRFTVWMDSNLRARIVRHDNLVSCDVSREYAGAYDPQFLASAGLVFWTEEAEDDSFRRDTFYMNPDGCKGKTRLSQANDFYFTVDDRGIILGDEFFSNDRTVSLKYAHVRKSAGGEWTVDPAIRIQSRVDSYPVMVGGHPLLLVFRTKEGGARPPGLYVFGPVPF
jgi:hypothetical protein